jgi:hypothetical protein
VTEDGRSATVVMEQHLFDRKGTIVDEWSRAVLATYPAETVSFLTAEKDPFCNPVGHVLTQTGELLFEIALRGVERGRAENGLGDIVRIRAVQDFSPSEALSFVDAMRKAIRHELLPMALEKTSLAHLLSIESRLDEALLIALDLYVECKKQIDDIRIKEAKAEKERLLRLIRAMGTKKGNSAAGGATWLD